MKNKLPRPDLLNRSDRAKVKAFEYALLGQGSYNVNKNDLREWYIRYLREEKAF